MVGAVAWVIAVKSDVEVQLGDGGGAKFKGILRGLCPSTAKSYQQRSMVTAVLARL